MELPFRPMTLSLTSQFKEWLSPFLLEPHSNEKAEIMNLSYVEHTLHDYFVTMEPLWITYEYYNFQDIVEMTTQCVYVISPIDRNRHIHVRPLSGGPVFSLETQQILAVSANIAV